MTTADHVVALAKAALDGDRTRVASTCRMIAASERENSTLKTRITKILERSADYAAMTESRIAADLKGLVLQMSPSLALPQVELPASVQSELDQFLVEQAHSDAIRETGLSVSHKILLSGPPGNGKTTLAGAIAKELNIPFLVMDFSTAIDSYMGATGGNLAKVFRGLENTRCVLFIDEMETVLSERGNVGGKSEVGEIGRVVSTLLLEIDRLSDQVILIGATNHDEMLDRAVVRRFDHHWTLPVPSESMVSSWLKRFASRYPAIPIDGYLPEIQAAGRSFSDIEREVKAWGRRWVIQQQTSNVLNP